MVISIKRIFKIIRIIILFVISLITIEVLSIWWQYHRAIIVIINNSGRQVSDLKIEMREGVQEIGILSAGSKGYARVFPHGESDFSISFMTPEKKLVRAPGGYIESTGGYKYTLTIAPDWTISKKSSLAQGCIILPLYNYYRMK